MHPPRCGIVETLQCRCCTYSVNDTKLSVAWLRLPLGADVQIHQREEELIE